MAKKEYLKLNLQKACNGYAAALCKMWDMEVSDGYWIGEEVGGLWDNGDMVTISLCDMVYCVENDIAFKEFQEWEEYNVACLHFHFTTMNLKSWHMGAPRIPQSTFDRLYGYENDFYDAVDKVNSEF